MPDLLGMAEAVPAGWDAYALIVIRFCEFVDLIYDLSAHCRTRSFALLVMDCGCFLDPLRMTPVRVLLA